MPIRESSPPTSFVMFNNDFCIFSTGDFSQTEPEKASFTVFFILLKISNVDIPIAVNFSSISTFLVVDKSSFVDSLIFINGHT